jgi:dephospho-CoA kinase
MERDRLTNNEAKLKIQAQWPLNQKIQLADVIINNTGGLKEWLPEVDKLC